MAFKSVSRKEQWQRFLAEHSDILSDLRDFDPLFSSPERFEELLQFGRIESDSTDVASFGDFSEFQWSQFQRFLYHYQRDWETYCPSGLYPVLERERERRK